MAWIDAQRKAFTRWLNARLSEAGQPQITDIVGGLQDGSLLCSLFEHWEGRSIKSLCKRNWKRHPNSKLGMLENCSIFLDACRRTGMELTNVGPSDLVDGTEKIVLGLVWRLIQTYGINEVSDSGKAGLLNWAKTTTAGYPGVNVTNFTSSWESGMAFCALVDALAKPLYEGSDLDFNFQDLSKGDALHNVERAFKVAKEYMHIPALLDPTDVASGAGQGGSKGSRRSRIDEQSMMSYISEFMAWEEQNRLDVLRAMEEERYSASMTEHSDEESDDESAEGLEPGDGHAPNTANLDVSPETPPRSAPTKKIPQPLQPNAGSSALPTIQPESVIKDANQLVRHVASEHSLPPLARFLVKLFQQFHIGTELRRKYLGQGGELMDTLFHFVASGADPRNTGRIGLNKFRRFARLARLVSTTSPTPTQLSPAEVDLIFVRTLQVIERDASRVLRRSAKGLITLSAKEKAAIEQRVAAARRRHLDASAFSVAIEQLAWAALWRTGHAAPLSPSSSKAFLRSPSKRGAGSAVMTVEDGAALRELPFMDIRRTSPSQRVKAVSFLLDKHLVPLAVDEALRRQDEHLEVEALKKQAEEEKVEPIEGALDARSDRQRTPEEAYSGARDGTRTSGQGEPDAGADAPLTTQSPIVHRYRKSDVGDLGAVLLQAMDDKKSSEAVSILTDALLRRLLMKNREQLESMFCLYGTQRSAADMKRLARRPSAKAWPREATVADAEEQGKLDPRDKPGPASGALLEERGQQKAARTAEAEKAAGTEGTAETAETAETTAARGERGSHASKAAAAAAATKEPLRGPASSSTRRRPSTSPVQEGVPPSHLLEAALVEGASAGSNAPSLRIRDPKASQEYVASWFQRMGEHRLLSQEEKLRALGSGRVLTPATASLLPLHPVVMRKQAMAAAAERKESAAEAAAPGPFAGSGSRASHGAGARAMSESGAGGPYGSSRSLRAIGSFTSAAPPPTTPPRPRRHRSCSDLGNSASLPHIPRDLVRVIEVFKIESDEPTEHALPLRRRSSSMRGSPLRHEVTVKDSSPDLRRVKRALQRDNSPIADIKVPKRVFAPRPRSRSSPLVVPPVSRLAELQQLHAAEAAAGKGSKAFPGLSAALSDSHEQRPHRPQRSRFRSDSDVPSGSTPAPRAEEVVTLWADASRGSGGLNLPLLQVAQHRSGDGEDSGAPAHAISSPLSAASTLSTPSSNAALSRSGSFLGSSGVESPVSPPRERRPSRSPSRRPCSPHLSRVRLSSLGDAAEPLELPAHAAALHFAGPKSPRTSPLASPLADDAGAPGAAGRRLDEAGTRAELSRSSPIFLPQDGAAPSSESSVSRAGADGSNKRERTALSTTDGGGGEAQRQRLAPRIAAHWRRRLSAPLASQPRTASAFNALAHGSSGSGSGGSSGRNSARLPRRATRPRIAAFTINAKQLIALCRDFQLIPTYIDMTGVISLVGEVAVLLSQASGSAEEELSHERQPALDYDGFEWFLSLVAFRARNASTRRHSAAAKPSGSTAAAQDDKRPSQCMQRLLQFMNASHGRQKLLSKSRGTTIPKPFNIR